MGSRSITFDATGVRELARTFERWRASDDRVGKLTASDCYLIGMRLDEGEKLEQHELRSILYTIHRADDENARLAGELLYKAYQSFVNRYLHKHHPRVAKIPEEDLVYLLSEPFVLVYKKIRIGHFYSKDNIKFTTYLIAFAKNLAINYFSEKKRLSENGARMAVKNPVSLDTPVGDEEDGTTLGEMLKDPNRSPEEILMDDYVLGILRNCVEEDSGRKRNLTEDQRQVVKLRAEGYSMEEICVVMGKSPRNGGNAAKNIYLRAKDNIKRIFLEELEGLGFSQKQLTDIGYTLDELSGGL
jgi:DNA-directed RNA polymerase specialized sigma24 family protein